MSGGGMFKVTARVDLSHWDPVMKRIEEGLDEGLHALAVMIKELAETSVSFQDRTGALRKTIRVQQDKATGHWYVRAGGTKRVYHAHLVEFGHDLIDSRGRKRGVVAARPFLGPAADTVLEKGAEVVARWIEDRTAGIELKVGG